MKNLFSMMAVLSLSLFCGARVSGEDVPLKDLSSLDELQKVFQNDAGKVRIIALLSPT